MNALPTSLLQRLLERPAPFALLYRPESNGPGLLDVIRGEALELHGLADLPLDHRRRQRQLDLHPVHADRQRYCGQRGGRGRRR